MRLIADVIDSVKRVGDWHMALHQGYAKLVGFDWSFGIERWYSVSNIGFDFDSRFCKKLNVDLDFERGIFDVFMLILILTQTWVICWFRFRFCLNFFEILRLDFDIDSVMGDMLVSVSVLIKSFWNFDAWFRYWLSGGCYVGFGFGFD